MTDTTAAAINEIREEVAASERRQQAFKRASELLQAQQPSPPPAPAIPWSRHGYFDDIAAAVAYVDKARAAMDCIGAMLQPHRRDADEQLNMVHRSQAADLFAFFAESLDEPLKTIDECREHLSMGLARAGL